MRSKRSLRTWPVLLAAALWVSAAVPQLAAGQAESEQSAANAQFVITAKAKGSQEAPLLKQGDISVELNGKPVQVASFTPLRGSDAKLQLVFLFDESTPSYLALQFPSIRKFIGSLPPGAEVGIAYMANGRAVFQQTLTSDHSKAASSLRLPNSIPGVSGSPYFCLSDLAKHWPSKTKTRRVVFMVTNGQDPYYQQANMQDPYLDASISDSQKAGLLVYSIYFHDRGFGSTGRLGTLFGQSYLLKVANDTGGETYSEAQTTPVSFDPFLKKFKTSIENQYMVGIVAKGKGLERVKVKTNLKNVKVSAPSAVNVSAE
jgi:hypothetical protein